MTAIEQAYGLLHAVLLIDDYRERGLIPDASADEMLAELSRTYDDLTARCGPTATRRYALRNVTTSGRFQRSWQEIPVAAGISEDPRCSGE